MPVAESAAPLAAEPAGTVAPALAATPGQQPAPPVPVAEATATSDTGPAIEVPAAPAAAPVPTAPATALKSAAAAMAEEPQVLLAIPEGPAGDPFAAVTSCLLSKRPNFTQQAHATVFLDAASGDLVAREHTLRLEPGARTPGEILDVVLAGPPRHLRGSGLLDAARVGELEALGMIWSKNANAWERGYAYAAAFHHQHGHLAIPAAAKLDDYAVGAWMRRQRKAENLTADQAAKLDALDELWRLEPDWNRSYRRLLAYLAAGGTLVGPANRTGLGDDPAFRPGSWLRKQEKARTDGKLTERQAALGDALHSAEKAGR